MADSVAQFIEALNLLNANASSLASTVEAMQQAFSTRPRLAKPVHQPDKEPEKSAAELEDEYWESSKATSAVTKIVGGEFSSTSILHELREVEKKIGDVTKAQEMGIISMRDAAGAIVSLGKDYADLSAVAAGKAVGGQAGAQLVSMATGAPKAAAGAGLDQITGIATGMMGLLGGTALGGGLFGLMLHGIKESDRLAAEAGEITNIFSAAGSTVSRGAMAHFANFQETAQQFYGIARQEVQGVLKEFMLAGVSIEEIMAGGHRGIGVVGHDVVTLSIGMDKMFEMSSGFTAQAAMQVVRNQGVGVGDAVDRIVKVEMLAHRASVSVADFTNEAVQASSELANYGIRVDSVAVAMSSLQERFKDIGLNSQAAMEFAQQGVKEISSGVKSAGLSVQVMLAEQLGLGSDVSARYKLLDSLQSGSQHSFIEVAQGLHRVASKQTKGTYGGSDEVREREYLERQGMGLMGSKAIYTIGEQVSRGQKIDEVSKQEWEDIRKAFQIEGTKTSDLQKKSMKLSKDLAKMGQGILFTITNFMALMIISIKTLMSVDWKMSVVEGMIKVTLGKSAAEMLRSVADAVGVSDTVASKSTEHILEMFHKQWSATAKAAKHAYSGMSDSLSAMNDIVKPLMRPIYMALDFDSMEESGASGSAGLTPAFWRDFDSMCARLGVDPVELKRVIAAETGWNAWGPERVNYVMDKDGRPKLDAQGNKIAQAKGLGAWIHNTAIKVAGMTEEQWQRLEYMSASEQLPFLEKTFRAMGVKGLTAEQIHVKMFGEGYLKTNPPLGGGGAMFIGKKWWESAAGKAWLAANPGYKTKALEQYNLYWQNKQLDLDDKGYITVDDLSKTTQRCGGCNRPLRDCRCPKVTVVSATRRRTALGPEVLVTLKIETPVEPAYIGPRAMKTRVTSADMLPEGMIKHLEAQGLRAPPPTAAPPVGCDPSNQSCSPPTTPTPSEGTP